LLIERTPNFVASGQLIENPQSNHWRAKEAKLAENPQKPKQVEAEALFKKAQKASEAEAEADAVRSKTARLRALRLAKEAAEKAGKNTQVQVAKKRST
jgi:hypothetical protein